MLMVNVIEHMELERIARLVGWFHAVNHASPGTVHKIAVQKRNRSKQFSGNFDFPQIQILEPKAAAENLES